MTERSITDHLGNAADNPAYVDRVNTALRSPADVWGEEQLACAAGPTYEAIKPLLAPLGIAGHSLTLSGFYYLAFSHPVPDSTSDLQERHYALHMADGSQIIADWSNLGDLQGELTKTFHNRRYNAHRTGRLRSVTFFVGLSGERFGEDLSRLHQPHLESGHLPILQLGYTGQDGLRWSHESFVCGVADSPAVISHLRLVALGEIGCTADVILRVDAGHLAAAELKGGDLLLDGHPAVSIHCPEAASITWSAPDLRITMPIISAEGPVMDVTIVTGDPSDSQLLPRPTAFAEQRDLVKQYWSSVLHEGSQVQVPEEVVQNAMRNLLIQQLSAGWRVAIGNSYEQLYIPECSQALLPLAQFGFLDRHKANLQELLDVTKGSSLYPNWEVGSKLTHVAYHYWLTRDAELVNTNLSAFRGALERMRRERAKDPHALLPPEWHSEDINEYIYGWHHQSVAWRGLRDFAAVLESVDRGGEAREFRIEADGLRDAIMTAIERAVQWLDDGSAYIPLDLFDNSPPYDPITRTRAGSYWNIAAPWAFATGILQPRSRLAEGVIQYVQNHGGTFLGLTRFNYYGLEVGACRPDGYEGYRSTGVDQQYGHAYLQFLADNDRADYVTLAMYSKLAHDMTPETYISGEGSTISPCPGLDGELRSFWNPPLGSNGASYLQALRLSLIHESFLRDGNPGAVMLLPATPRSWLDVGRVVKFSRLPTTCGPVSLEMQRADQETISGAVRRHGLGWPALPVQLRLRVPATSRVLGVSVDGTECEFDPDTQTAILPSDSERMTVRARLRPQNK
jgi:hypothetical protein